MENEDKSILDQDDLDLVKELMDYIDRDLSEYREPESDNKEAEK